jgi:hypothetical protein
LGIEFEGKKKKTFLQEVMMWDYALIEGYSWYSERRV